MILSVLWYDNCVCFIGDPVPNFLCLISIYNGTTDRCCPPAEFFFFLQIHDGLKIMMSKKLKTLVKLIVNQRGVSSHKLSCSNTVFANWTRTLSIQHLPMGRNPSMNPIWPPRFVTAKTRLGFVSASLMGRATDRYRMRQ